MINFTDLIYIAVPGEMDEDTGFLAEGFYSTASCRIQFGASKITNYEGNEIVAQAKIYLSPDSGINLNNKIKLSSDENAREMVIQSIEYKADLRGNINHILVYV